ncbi:hypothetical protein ABPG72_010568 [Tetrahymena utriculariae]
MSKIYDGSESSIISPVKIQIDQTANDFDLALNYLKKIPNKRTNHENYMIFRVMMQIKFFKELAQDYGKETAEICCSCLRYKCTQPGQTLFKQGDRGDAFYIIMKGSVGVNIKTYTSIEDSQKKTEVNVDYNKLQISPNQNQKEKNQAISYKTSNKLMVMNNLHRNPTEQKSIYHNEFNIDTLEKQNEDFEEKLLLQPILQEVKVLKTGDSFGELALLKGTKGSLRAATIISKELTYYAYLVKEDFQNILKDKEQGKLDQNIANFSKCRLFEGLDENELRTIFLYCWTKQMKRDHVVYKQNDSSDFFYIIKSGEFQIIKSQQIKDKKDVQYYENVQMPLSFRNYHGRIQKEIAISILSSGQFFGHIEILQKASRKYTVKCISSQGELYAISSNDFIRKLYYHQKSFLKKRLISDRKIHSQLYEQHDEKFKDMNEQNSHLLLQNSYDKQFYDKILYYTKNTSVKLPSVLQNIVLSSRGINNSKININENQNLYPNVQDQLKQQLSFLNSSINQQNQSLSSQINFSKQIINTNLSILNDDKKRKLDNSTSFAVNLLNSSQIDNKEHRLNENMSNSLNLKKQFSELSLKSGALNNNLDLNSFKQKEFEIQLKKIKSSSNQNYPYLQQIDQNINIASQNDHVQEQAKIDLQKQQGIPFSLSLNAQQENINSEVVMLEDQNIHKSNQKIVKNKQIIEANPQIQPQQIFNDSQLKRQKYSLSISKQTILPQIKYSYSSNKKSLFTNIMSNSLNQKDLNLDSKIYQNSTEIQPFAKFYTEDFQADSFIHTNSFYSQLEIDDREKQDAITKIDGVDHIQIQQENLLKSDQFLGTKNSEQITQCDDQKKRLDLFHERQKFEKEQSSIEKHHKLIMEMENIQEQERQKKQNIQQSAIKVINKMDGYRQLKQKLESIQLAIQAKSEKGPVSKQTKKEIMNRFFSFIKNIDLAKIQSKKTDRYQFADFRVFEKAIEQKTLSIKAQHQKKKSSFTQKANPIQNSS